MAVEETVQEAGEIAYRWTRGKVVLLLVGALLFGGGVAVSGPAETVDTNGALSQSGTSERHGLLPNGFTDTDGSRPGILPGGLPDDTAAESEVDGSASPAMVRGGLGLLLGFCVGYAARVFLRMAALVVGIAFLIVMFFAYLGWVDVRWDVMNDQLGSIFSTLGEQLRSFRTFVTGHIPSTGAAAAGAFVGWKQ